MKRWVGQAPLLTGAVPRGRTEGSRKSSFCRAICSPLGSFQVPGSPAAPGSPEYSPQSKKTKKAALSAGQLPKLAPQKDQVRRLDQGLGRREGGGVWGNWPADSILCLQVPSKVTFSELKSCLQRARELGARAQELRASAQGNDAGQPSTLEAKESPAEPW